MQLNKSKLNFRFSLVLFAVGIATFAVHEFAHWIAGVVLGYEMLASPNHVWPIGDIDPADATLISTAGPLITIIQGVLGYFLVRRRDSLFGFALIYTAFFTRLLAAVVSISNPNDEARISSYLGYGQWTIPTVVVIALLVLTYLASRRLKLSFRDQFLCYAAASLAVSLVVGIDYVFFFGKA
jgi:hypothetical protein